MITDDEIFPIYKKKGQECENVYVSEEDYREHLQKEMGQTLTPANLSRYIEHSVDSIKRQSRQSAVNLQKLMK